MSEQFHSDSIKEIQNFRRILSSMRVRFAPETQPVKRAALEEIVKNVLFAYANSTGKTVGEIQALLADECSMPGLGETQLYETLLHLEKAGEIQERRADTKSRYCLEEAVASAIGNRRAQSEAQLDEIVGHLFVNAPNGSALYKEPFIQSVCLIFAELAEESAALVLGEQLGAGKAPADPLEAAIQTVAEHFPDANKEFLEAGLRDFFRERDPRYSTFQLALAQNYFVVKTLGVDPDGSALSREIFENAVFYLDTNVIIGSLAPSQGRKESVQAVVDACRAAGARFTVCQITLDELRAVQARRREDRAELEGYVPAGIDIKGVTKSGRRQVVAPPLEFDDSFLRIQDLSGSVNETFEADRADDQWFDQARDEGWVQELTEAIRARTVTKGKRQVLHDVLLLGWANRQRLEFGEKAFVLTADRSLPSVSPPKSTERIAITHTALLQWAAPVLGRSEENFAVAFAELTRARLLPQSQMLSLNDFRVFRELHISTGALPAEDVEGCIRYLRRAAPTLDPRNPRDIQELARHVSGFFADPSRKYLREISQLKSELNTADSQKAAAIEAERSNFEKATGEVQRLKKEHQAYVKKLKRRADENKASFRLIVVTSIALGVVAVVALAAASLQSGMESIFVKISAAWPFMLGLGVLVWVVGAWVFVGRKGLRILRLKLPYQR